MPRLHRLSLPISTPPRFLLLSFVLLTGSGCADDAAGPRAPTQPAVPLAGHGAWVWWQTVDRYGADEVVRVLHESGVEHLFVLVKSISGEVRDSHLDELLPAAHASGMYVHAWFGSFRDDRLDPPYVDPADPAYRAYLLDVISGFLRPRASGHSIDGVHLDYVRYRRDAPQTAPVTSFVAEVRSLIDEIAPGTVLSAATKAEGFESPAGLAASARHYGQEYADLARYIDLFCPMTYHLDYGVSPTEAVRAAGWVAELTGRPVLAGIQLHPGPAGNSPTVAELREGLGAARVVGLPGVVFFRAENLITSADYREAAAASKARTGEDVP